MAKNDPLDALGRRKRNAKPKSTGKRVHLVPADVLAFQLIDDHGLLPLNYIYDGTKHIRRNKYNTQKRFGDFYNEKLTQHGGTYVSRPSAQWDSILAREQPVTYMLTDHGRDVIKEHGSRLHHTRTDPFPHRFMNACVTASIRLACTDGVRFVHLKEVLSHPKCPPKTSQSKNPLAMPLRQGRIVPDDLTGLCKDNKFTFFAWEQDRSTETMKTLREKFEGYLYVLQNETYKAHFGIPNMYVVVMTTSKFRMRGIINQLKEATEHAPHFRKHFLFKQNKSFKQQWTVPPVMYELYNEPWERCELPPIKIADI